jgi:hypothetical protein
MSEGMPAMLAALKVVGIASELTEEQVKQALDHVSKSGATYGVLWGYGAGGREALDLLEYLGEIVQQLDNLKEDKRYPLALIALRKKEAEQDVDIADRPRGSIFRRPPQ